jgi:hypothetical protein
MRLRPSVLAATAAAVQLAVLPIAAAWKAPQIATTTPKPNKAYTKVVQRVAGMVNDEAAYAKVQKKGLQLINVLWEDTGRWEGSSVGPNISDVTIEVEAANGRHYLMPVMRYDNFTDTTADVKMDKIFVPVGNEDGTALETITLRDLLAEPSAYLSLPGKGKIKKGSLLAKRDSHVLVSAQHAFLPVPEDGQAKFWPVIFNYQSSKKNPAVLTILVTRQGTSMTIIDNTRDTVTGEGSWGQRLYFNSHGEKAPLIAERLKDVQENGVTANGEAAASLGEDANLLMLIQVPLKFRESPRYNEYGGAASAAGDADMEAAPAKSAKPMTKPTDDSRGGDRSDVDTAVIGHGDTEGPYIELDGLTIERDARFPVRVTVQFYQATSNGVLSSEDVGRMAKQIRNVYKKGDYVGSLVVPDPGDRLRPTNWTGVTTAPGGWVTFPGIQERYRRYGALYFPESAVTGVIAAQQPAPAPVAGIAGP